MKSREQLSLMHGLSIWSLERSIKYDLGAMSDLERNYLGRLLNSANYWFTAYDIDNLGIRLRKVINAADDEVSLRELNHMFDYVLAIVVTFS